MTADTLLLGCDNNGLFLEAMSRGSSDCRTTRIESLQHFRWVVGGLRDYDGDFYASSSFDFAEEYVTDPDTLRVVDDIRDWLHAEGRY